MDNMIWWDILIYHQCEIVNTTQSLDAEEVYLVFIFRSRLDVLPGRLGRVLKLVLEAGPHSVRPVNRFRHFRNIYILLHYHSIFIRILFSFFRRMTDIKWIIHFFLGEMYFYHVYILTDGLKRFVLILNKSF